MKYTPSQQDAVEAWGGDVCVVAGPGSGKTTVLVERLRWLVREKRVDPSRILAITFTEKAANEMLERLTRGAEKDFAARLARIEVSTVHAFCSRLLRDNALEAGIDPDFTILEDVDATFELYAALDQAFEEAYEEDKATSVRVMRAVAETDLRAGLAKIVQDRLAAPDRPRVPVPDASRALRELAPVVREIATLAGGPEVAAQADELESAGRALQPDSLATLDRVFDALSALNPGRKKASKEAWKPFKERTFPVTRALVAGEVFAPEKQWLESVAAAAEEGFAQRKRRLAALDFQDLERETVRLLCRSDLSAPPIDHILVDEFQDTSPIQAKLIDALRARVADPDGGVFGVGDLNQAIYGFRNADPTVFLRFREKVQKDGGTVVRLRENFRSRADVLEFVGAMTGGAEGIEPHTLTPGAEFPPKEGPSAEVLLVYDSDGETRRATEAQAVAARIRELRAELRFGPNAESPAWASFAILARTRAIGEEFAAVFRREGIPVELEAGKGFWESAAVADCYHALRALTDPSDDLSLATVLLSPIGGFDPETLARLRLAADGAVRPLADGFDEEASRDNEPAAERLRQFQERWATYRAAARTERLDLVLDRMLGEAGYRAWWEKQPEGGVALANIAKLLRMLRRWDAQFALTLPEIVSRLARMQALGGTEEQGFLPRPDRDAVRILTAHKAKGLQYPVVFLVSSQSPPRNDSPPLTHSAEHGLGVRWLAPLGDEPIGDYAMIATAKDRAAAAAQESHRLLYVALTRAQEHVVVSASFGEKPQKREWARRFGAALSIDVGDQTLGVTEVSAGGTHVRVTRTAPGPTLVERPSTAEPDARLRVLEPLAESRGAASEAAATAIVRFAECPRRYWLEQAGHKPDVSVASQAAPSAGERQQMPATELGQQVHAVLAGEKTEASSLAVELADRFRGSRLGQRVNKAKVVERELEILAPIAGHLVRCRIDLWFADRDGAVLVDYKTDAVSAEDVPRRARAYELQMRLYALALQVWRGGAPSSAVLAFLRPSVEHAVSLREGDLAAASQAVGQFFAAQESGEYPLRPAAGCSGCPFWGGVCPGVD